MVWFSNPPEFRRWSIGQTQNKTAEEKQNVSPYCSCGVSQVSRRHGSPIYLKVVMLSPCFFSQNINCGPPSQRRMHVACSRSAWHNTAADLYVLLRLSAKVISEWEGQTTACIKLFQTLQYRGNKITFLRIPIQRKRTRCVVIALILCMRLMARRLLWVFWPRTIR